MSGEVLSSDVSDLLFTVRLCDTLAKIARCLLSFDSLCGATSGHYSPCEEGRHQSHRLTIPLEATESTGSPVSKNSQRPVGPATLTGCGRNEVRVVHWSLLPTSRLLHLTIRQVLLRAPVMKIENTAPTATIALVPPNFALDVDPPMNSTASSRPLASPPIRKTIIMIPQNTDPRGRCDFCSLVPSLVLIMGGQGLVGPTCQSGGSTAGLTGSLK